MKKCILLMVAAALSFTLYAQPPVGDANAGDKYGDDITAKGAITLEQLAKKLKKSDTYTGKIKGKAVAVCPKKGCWVTMEMPGNKTMQIKFKDYSFFVPTAVAGKTIVLDGVATKKLVSVDELKHYAEDAKKSQAEIDAITQPEERVSFLATGVVVI
ncbi:MAG: DUF4920 domain-containing protein [Niabella sp.]